MLAAALASAAALFACGFVATRMGTESAARITLIAAAVGVVALRDYFIWQAALLGGSAYLSHLAANSGRPVRQRGRGADERFTDPLAQGEPSPPHPHPLVPRRAYVMGSTSTPLVRASQCTCGSVRYPLEPTDRDPLTGDYPSPSSTCVAGGVVTDLEAPFEQDADRESSTAAPARPSDGPESLATTAHHTAPRCRSRCAHTRRAAYDPLRRPADARREHSRRLAHDETEAW